MNESYSFSGNESFRDHDFNENEVKTILDLGFSCEDLRLVLNGAAMAEGSFALIFDLSKINKKMIVKVWKNPKNDYLRANHENVALRLLKSKKIKCVPEIKGYIDSVPLLFEEKIDGSRIDIIDLDVIERLSKVLASIHSIKLNSFGKPLSKRTTGTQMDFLKSELSIVKDKIKLLTHEDAYDLLCLGVERIEVNALENSKNFESRVFTLIHFDLNPNNILISDDKKEISIIDWEQASAGDATMDIAKLFLKLGFDSSQKRVFLDGYLQDVDSDNNQFTNRLSIYEQFVLINSIVWRCDVLKSDLRSSKVKNEKDFYDRVSYNYRSELDKLNYLLNKK